MKISANRPAAIWLGCLVILFASGIGLQPVSNRIGFQPVNVLAVFQGCCGTATALGQSEQGSQAAPAEAKSSDAPAKVRFAIVVHGGTVSEDDRYSDEERRSREEGLKKALLAARAIVEKNGSALDAVEQAIRVLEDDPLFNAGRGAVFNADGHHELDASIMEGREKACGAVAGVKTVKNPISLARLVMTKTRHVLLSSDGADRFAEEMGVERVSNDYFSTPAARKEWEEVKAAREKESRKAAAGKKVSREAEERETARHLGTVGCVVLDMHGDLAAGTSTGGLTDKKFGRVGDSPIIGAGTYADNATCAVSCTGIGEHFIRHAVSHDVSALMAYKQLDVASAVRTVLRERLKPRQGGIIAVDRQGNMVGDYNTVGLARGMTDSTGRLEVRVGQ